jgi:phosphoribosylformylglycinamidine cyclo-ligase
MMANLAKYKSFTYVAFPMKPSEGKTYSQAGVNLAVADETAERITALLPKTFRKGCISLPGGFAGLFDLKTEGLEDTLLVMSTNRVNTKIKLAIELNAYKGLGIDLVAMSVNDVITLGAKPLCFLDYIALGKIERQQLLTLVEGVVEGCLQSECALMGGETAEMPGLYREGDFDLAGFCVGAVPRQQLINGSKIAVGDVIIGVPSSGIHSNGYSLVRSILEDVPPAEVQAQAQALMEPTRIYARLVGEVCKKISVKGMAHITGSGLAGNVTRVIPEGMLAEMRWGSWKVPEIFQWLQKWGKVTDTEMLNVFNMGIGYVFIVHKADQSELLKLLKGEGVVMGEIKPLAKKLPDDMRAIVC